MKFNRLLPLLAAVMVEFAFFGLWYALATVAIIWASWFIASHS